MKTKFVNQKEYRNQSAEIFRDLKTVFTKTSIALSEKLYPIEKDSYHFITRLLKTSHNERVKNSICSLLYRDIFKSEILSAGGGEIAFLFSLDFANKILNDTEIDLTNQTRNLKQLDIALEKLKKFVEASTCQISETSLKYSLTETCNDKTLSTLCYEAIKLAGIEGKIHIEDSKQNNYTIEMKEGYSFELQPAKFFLDNNNTSWERKECKILVVDGFVEEVSEIDQLLIQAHERKQPMAIIAHGFSEEVIATLSTNKARGALDVNPIKLKNDINSLNMINDIGVVSGMDPISSLKGQLISFVRFDDLPTVEKIIVTEQKTTIENQKTTNAALSQIKMLLDKRFDVQTVEDVQNMLDKRIKSLTANSVTIYLPAMSQIKNDATRIKIDNTLRQAKTLLNYGLYADWELFDSLNYNPITTELDDYKDKIPAADNDIENILFKTLSTMILANKNYSPLSYYLGVLLASRTILMLLSTSGFVEMEVD